MKYIKNISYIELLYITLLLYSITVVYYLFDCIKFGNIDQRFIFAFWPFNFLSKILIQNFIAKYIMFPCKINLKI